MSSLEGLHRRLEGSTFLYFGPYAFTAGKAFVNETTLAIEGEQRLWPYKFDTTSIAIRAFAEHLNVTSWPACFFYKEESEDCVFDAWIPRELVFTMLDGLVNAVANSTKNEMGLQIMTKHLWQDRFHHLLLTQVFFNQRRRINHALYLPPHVASKSKLCDRRFGSRPHFCGDFWLDHRKSCGRGNDVCMARGKLNEHIHARAAAFQDTYANESVDVVIIEGSEMHGHGSMSFEGRRAFDVVTIFRARQCKSDSCRTIAVEDYRYEGTIGTSNISDWYYIIWSLRMLGQIYAWVRMGLLLYGCARLTTFARSSSGESNISAWISRFLQLLVSIPTSVIVFGSLLPISLYSLAFFLDSNIHNEILARRLATNLSMVFQEEPLQFFQDAAIQMRNVWPLLFLIHVFAAIATSRNPTSASVDGVIGMPGNVPYILSALTMFSYYRSFGYRDTRVLEIMQLPTSERFSLLRRFQFNSTRSYWSRLLLGGDTIDHKVLLCLVVLTAGILTSIRVLVWMLRVPYYITAWQRTQVPAAAKALWSTTMFGISWKEGVTSPTTTEKSKRSGSRVTSVSNLKLGKQQESARLISDQVTDAMIAVNLVALTDPIVLLWLHSFRSSRAMMFVEHKSSKALKLIPAESFKLNCAVGEIDAENWNIVLLTQAGKLSWLDLVHCS